MTDKIELAYNTKELQTQTGYYDYGFRQLDPALGRWHVVDALAESYYSSSPYTYTENDPINRIDIAGLGWVYQSDPTFDSDGKVNGWNNYWQQTDGEGNAVGPPGNVTHTSSSAWSSGSGMDVVDKFGDFWQSGIGTFLMILDGWSVGYTGAYYQRFVKNINNWSKNDPGYFEIGPVISPSDFVGWGYKINDKECYKCGKIGNTQFQKRNNKGNYPSVYPSKNKRTYLYYTKDNSLGKSAGASSINIINGATKYMIGEINKGTPVKTIIDRPGGLSSNR